MSLQILDIVDGNAFDPAQEKATGTDGVIVKAGQGMLEYRWREYVDACILNGLPWGVYWVVDARYHPDKQKGALKAAFPDGDFGPLGLWLDVEKPVIWWPDWLYRMQPYAYYKPIESILRSMLDWSRTGVGIYTSKSQWALCAGIVPDALANWFATMPLWVAHYKAITPLMPGKWTQYAMWQYQEGPDYSVAEPVWYYSKIAPVVEPPVPPVEPPVEPPAADARPYVVNAQFGAKIRKQPSLTAERVGALPDGTQIYGVTTGEWLQLGGYVFSALVAEPGNVPAPEPEPEPEPLPDGDFYQVLHDQDCDEYGYKPRQSEPKRDEKGNIIGYDYHGKPETVRTQVDLAEAVAMTRGMQQFMFEALKRKAPAGLDVGEEYRSLYKFDRAFNNGQGYGKPGDPRADFVNGRDETEPLPKLLPPVVTGGKVVKRMDAELYTKGGEKCYKVETLKAGSLPDIAVDNIDTMPWHWIPATVGTIVSVATGKEDREFTAGPWRVDPFPQLGGNTVPVPHITNTGYCYIPARRLARISDPFKASPYVPER